MPHGRREISGYTDIGKLFIPPIPHGVAMTDRGTGTVYLLSDGTVDANGDARLNLISPLPSSFNTNTLGPLAGPYLDIADGQVRLFVRDGRLGFEDVIGRKENQAGIVTRRKGATRDMWEVTGENVTEGRTEPRRVLVYEQKVKSGKIV